MRRTEFTRRLWRILKYAEDCGYNVIVDNVKRSQLEQLRLFEAGLSKCDGTSHISQHQYGKAVDIYIIVSGKVSDDRIKYLILHKYWGYLGGKPMIPWDMGHFE